MSRIYVFLLCVDMFINVFYFSVVHTLKVYALNMINETRCQISKQRLAICMNDEVKGDMDILPLTARNDR